MNVYVKLKSAGKRRPALDSAPYALPDGIASLRQLIEAVVRQETAGYNSQGAYIPAICRRRPQDRRDTYEDTALRG